MSKLFQVRGDDVVSLKINQSIVRGNHGNCGCKRRNFLESRSVREAGGVGS